MRGTLRGREGYARASSSLRAVASNFLFSTGANENAGRYTAGHFDLPMRGCTVALDGYSSGPGGTDPGGITIPAAACVAAVRELTPSFW